MGILFPSLSRDAPFLQAFEQCLQALGYREGHNLAIEFRTAEGQSEGLPALAAELTQLPVDVLVAAAYEDTLRAARQATNSIHNDCRHAAGHVDARLQQDMSCR